MKPQYRSRIADDLLTKKLDAFGGALIVGAKGCGKTTTAKQKAKSFVEFQDEDNRERYLSVANSMPSRLLIGEKPRLFDEWQDAPKIWGAIRKSIDDEGENGLYILTGSSAQEVETPHTGTSRISTLKMYPMSLYESGESTGEASLLELFFKKEIPFVESKLSFESLVFALCRGGWPRSLSNKTRESQLALAEDLFYQTCHVDISKIDKVKRDPLIAESILRTYARNICTCAKATTMMSDAPSPISSATFYDYVGALQKLHIIEDIPAWCPAIRSKSAARSGLKRNLVDPSLAVAALGLSPEYFNYDFKTLGFLFESLCIRDLRVYSAKMNGEVSYYRDRYGLEADCVLHLKDGRYALIEFKLGQDQIDLGAKHLCEIERLIKEHNESEPSSSLRLPELKLIITGGGMSEKREDGVLVLPISCLKD